MFRKIKRYLKDPYWALGYDLIKSHPKWMSDKFYISTLWRMVMGYKLNLKNPQTFNEKLQWMKLYDRNPLYTTLVDKLRVKEIVSKKIGPKYVIPTLAIYNSVDEIDIDKLPSKFVLKCNHDSGSVAICNDKTKFDIEAVKKKFALSLKRNFYWEAREWAYKNVRPCIFAEEYIEYDNNLFSTELMDYKFFCFDGIPTIMYIANDGAKLNENSYQTTDFFDMEFNHLNMRMKDPNAPIIPKKPIHFDEMKELASKLSSSLPAVRIDFYDTPRGVLFGEYTFYHSAGFAEIHPEEWRYKLGDMIKIK